MASAVKRDVRACGLSEAEGSLERKAALWHVDVGRPVESRISATISLLDFMQLLFFQQKVP